MDYKHFLIETKEVATHIARDLAMLGYWQKVIHDSNTGSYELITKADSNKVYTLYNNYMGGTKTWIIL